jgi:DUF4097 and DUF4098 domain-containing protein YvlB
MKRYLWILMAAPVALAVAGCEALRARAEIVEHRTWDFSGIAEVRVETKNGAVDIDGEEGRTEIDVHITRFARGRTEEEARENAEAVSVEVSRESPDSPVLLVIVNVPSELRNKSAGADLDISLPPRVDLEIRTSNGHVGVKEIEGLVDVVTSNGKVEISQVDGDILAKTSNGAIVVEDVVGNTELRSSNGGITLHRVDAETIVATTSNGRIDANEVTGSAEVETSNGSIELKSTALPDRPRLKAKTTNGGILMEVPSTVNAHLSLQTSNGSIHQKLSDASVTDYEQSKRRIAATLNGGGGHIEARTSNGSITFRTSTE